LAAKSRTIRITQNSKVIMQFIKTGFLITKDKGEHKYGAIYIHSYILFSDQTKSLHSFDKTDKFCPDQDNLLLFF